MHENLKILVVDDDPDILAATARIVESQGCTVLRASSGTHGKALAKQERPDLVLLDVMLPDMDGTDLCRDLKSDPALAGMFIVLTSGVKTSSPDQADGLECGADGYIARPVSNREFKARVDALVRILVSERERDRLIKELQEALSKVKQLSGLLPICSYCRKIRDDKGYWNQVEEFLQENSGVELGERICPACAKTLFPGVSIYGD